MGGLTYYHKCKCEAFLHRLSMNLIGQCGKTHILLVLILQKENTNINMYILYVCAYCF